MLINPFKSKKTGEFTALDFGHNSLKLVHCKLEKEQIVLRDWQKQRLPAGVINEGIVDNASILKVAVSNLLHNTAYKPGKLLIAPAPGQEFIHRLRLPDIAEENIQEVLDNKLETHLSLSPDDVYSDYLILDEQENCWQILLLAVPGGVLEGYRKLFKNNPFYPQVANFQSLALVSLLRYQNKLNNVSLIVNMDIVKSRLVIADADDFYADIITELGGKDFSWVFKDEQKGWSEEDISSMKRAMNTKTIEEDSQAEKLAENLQEEIEAAIKEQEKKFPGHPVADIYITGGGFRLQGLKDYLEEKLSFDITVIEPMEGIKLDMIESSQNERKLYLEDKNMISTALGLVASEVLHDEG